MEAWLAHRSLATLGLRVDRQAANALALAEALLASGATVRAFDPKAAARAAEALPELQIAGSPAEAAADADALVIATEWPEFADLDWASLGERMRRRLVVDGKRLLDPAQLRSLGFEYEAVGSPGAARRPALRPVGPGRERRDAGVPSTVETRSLAGGSPTSGPKA
jgi:UDPglucose 6-dehydrogenase